MRNLLYVVSIKDSANNEYIKIGISDSMKSRMSHLQNGNPFKVNIRNLYSLEANRKMEKFLHERLRSHRTFGEWFELNSESLELLDRVLMKMNKLKVEISNNKIIPFEILEILNKEEVGDA